jgi:hypothetical protein
LKTTTILAKKLECELPLLQSFIESSPTFVFFDFPRGTYSFVHLATHKETKAQYAVKVVDKTLLTSKQRERLYLEVDILKNLDHPFIISLEETFDTPDRLYILMEMWVHYSRLNQTTRTS